MDTIDTRDIALGIVEAASESTKALLSAFTRNIMHTKKTSFPAREILNLLAGTSVGEAGDEQLALALLQALPSWVLEWLTLTCAARPEHVAFLERMQRGG